MKKISRISIVILVSLLTVLLLSLGFYGGFRARSIINSSAEKYANLYIEEMENSLNNTLEEIETSVNNLSILAKDGLTKDTLADDDLRDGYTEKLIKVIVSVSKSLSSDVASYLRFNPDLAPSTSGIFVNRSDDFTVNNPTDFASFDTSATEVSWYYIPIQNKKATWMDPYYNANNGIYMISYVIPMFFEDGTPAGVIGMDLDFDVMLASLDDEPPYKNSYMVLTDKNGYILTEGENQGKLFEEPYRCYIAESELPNGMTIMAIIPYLSLNSEGNALIIEISVAMIIILVIFFILIAFAGISLSRREKAQNKLNNEMHSLSEIYISMHNISIKNNAIHEYSSTESISRLFQKPFPKIREVLTYVMKQTASDSDFNTMKGFINFDTLASRMNGKKTISQEFLSKNDGWCRARFISIDNVDVTDEVIFALELINEEKEKENKLTYLSETDLMTQLKNRGAGEKAIREMLVRKKKGAFLLMDIDKFKRYNDTYGHAAGDDVIIAVARTLKLIFSAENIVMRLGGDEFAVYLPGIVSEALIKEKIYVLFSQIDAIKLESIKNTKITISLGVSVYDGESDMTFETMYHVADLGTYESKNSEGNAYTFKKQ